MKWSIHQLNKYRSKGLEIDEMVTFDVSDWNTDIRNVFPVHVTGKAEFSANKYTFHLRVQGTMILPCSRTLEDVLYPFDIITTEVFVASQEEYVAYVDVHYLQGEVLDLLPVIKENIILEIPMQVFSEKALEEALSKGQDWQVITKKVKTEDVDPRLANLAKFFDKR
ncbi:YceD family protein [Ectobacillus polymachus]|uniref:YceD family protein n=1 Tax=Ectobacillus polymachus TaxID=1508806 RepID=UPI003A8AF3F8